MNITSISLFSQKTNFSSTRWEVQNSNKKLERAIDKAISNGVDLPMRDIAKSANLSINAAYSRIYHYKGLFDKWTTMKQISARKSQEQLQTRNEKRKQALDDMEKVAALLQEAKDNGATISAKEISKKTGISPNRAYHMASLCIDLWNDVKFHPRAVYTKEKMDEQADLLYDIFACALIDDETLSLEDIEEISGLNIGIIKSRIKKYDRLSFLWQKVSRGINRSH